MTEEELYLLQFSSRQMAESRMYDDYAACGINGEVSADEGEASKVVSCQHSVLPSKSSEFHFLPPDGHLTGARNSIGSRSASPHLQKPALVPV